MDDERAETQLASDVKLIVGGNFSKDALGPLYDQVLARVKSKPADYLREFEALYLMRPANARVQSSLHLPAMLELLRELEPARVKQIAGRLLHQYDTAMSVADAVVEEDGTLEALPTGTSAMARRLERRRATLRKLVAGGGR